MVNCAVSCIKYIIFAFNFLFFIIGISLFGGGIYTIAAHYPTEMHAGDVVFYAPSVQYVITIVGFIISVIAFLGCCGAIMQSTCMLSSYSIVMAILLVTQLGFGLYALINYDILMEKGLDSTLKATKEHKNLRKAWDRIQTNNKCCGVNKPSDWEPVFGQNKYLPPTCCPKNWTDEKNWTQCTIDEATQTGCKQKLVEYAKEHLIVWISLGFSVVILVQFVGTLFTCILYYTYRKKHYGLSALY